MNGYKESNLENGGITISSHSKPCVSCRKRKVRCDKARPCSNCSRLKQLCTYDTGDGVASGQETAPANDEDIRERLARLEALMASMMMRESSHSSPSSTNSQVEASQLGQGLNLQPRLANASAKLLAGTGAGYDHNSRPKHYPVGLKIFQEGCSRYYDSDFWPGLISEVEELRSLFNIPPTSKGISPWISLSSIGLQLPQNTLDIAAMHPTLDESNKLLQFFFKDVNPFLRIMHLSHFGKELDQYRRGTFFMPLEFEGLLFSVYTLAANNMSPQMAETIFGLNKCVLVERFHRATQIALTRVNFVTGESVNTMQALLHYITFLFQQSTHSQSQDALALLAVTWRVATNMGIHRDPEKFPLSPWVCEIRRRMFNHLSILDGLALGSFGVESQMPMTADTTPPKNANDEEWHASRFALPSSVPSDATGCKGMTFALAHREIADLTRDISRLDSRELKERENLIRQTEMNLNTKYLKGLDRSNPSQTVVAAFVEVSLSSLKLVNRYRKAMETDASLRDNEMHHVFVSAVELLEAYDYHISTFTPRNWGWIFEVAVPWLAIAIVITHLPKLTRKSDMDRAKKQVDIAFLRYEDPNRSIGGSPLWQLLVELRLKMDGSWSREQMRQDSLPLADVSQTATSFSDPSMRYTDDLMLDLGNFAGQQDRMMYEETLYMHDTANLPW
ncbi:hypothetical protein F5884DRAFT_81820 [Xylogone sp. PMI_703]|nr:hypothetical protein F5884DRAFT_81820 [Xylogone sp. PMI_703]